MKIVIQHVNECKKLPPESQKKLFLFMVPRRTLVGERLLLDRPPRPPTAAEAQGQRWPGRARPGRARPGQARPV